MIPAEKSPKRLAGRALVIYNPAAGFWDVEPDLDRALDYLAHQSWDLDLRKTTGKGSAEAIAQEAVAKEIDAVIVAGGDGTLSETANGLAGSEVALGVLPAGIANVWALETGFLKRPFWRPDLIAAAQKLCRGRIRSVDLGRANGRFFLLWVGVGLDAQVLRKIDPRAKSRLGVFHYLQVGLGPALRPSGTATTLVSDGEKMRDHAILVVISNVRLYAGLACIAPGARVDDGLLEVCALRGKGGLKAAPQLARLLWGDHLGKALTYYRQARQIRVTTDPPQPFQVDGDLSGVTPVEIEVAPRALRAVVAPGGGQKLFRSQPQEEAKTAVSDGA